MVLHPKVEQTLARLSQAGAGSFLFYGSKGVGKATAVREIAKQINCPKKGDSCVICRQIEGGNFPGLITIEPVEGKQKISIGQVRNLIDELALSTYYRDKPRLALIDPADLLTPEGQNALLKTLEEPPAKTMIILIATDRDRLLPTVLSRVQSIFFPSLSVSVVEPTISSDQANLIARLSRGSIGAAKELVKNQSEREKTSRLASLSGQTLKNSTFDRLMLVPEILSLDPLIGRFLNFLAAAAGKSLRDGKIGSTKGGQLLRAINRTNELIAANVSPKSALEGLMLEVESV